MAPLSKCKIIQMLFVLLFLSANSFSQEFKISPLITVPGDNRNFSITSPLIEYQSHNSFICWENSLESKYTIYLMQIDPLDKNIYTVWSDSVPNLNPVITYYDADSSVRIVWQSYKNGHSILYSRNFKDNTFSEINIETDTLKNSISPSLSNGAQVWIEEGKLLYRTSPLLYRLSTTKTAEFSLDQTETMVVDSNDCANPVVYPYKESMDPLILYEKGVNGNKQIYCARYVGQIREQEPYWEIIKISDGTENINPAFTIFGGIIYQTKVNSIWKIVLTNDIGSVQQKSQNVSCSFEHPVKFDYPIYTGGTSREIFPRLTVFDTDSIANNREIFISYNYMDGRRDTLANFSNASGDDFKPKAAFLNHFDDSYPAARDSSKLCIAWEHRENNKTDIWWAVSPCRLPGPGDVQDNMARYKFTLNQNYPNPFNPATKITYSLPVGQNVRIKVYDMLGKEVKTLVNEFKSAGEHSVQFNAGGLPSGMYVYTIQAGEYRASRKLMVLK